MTKWIFLISLLVCRLALLAQPPITIESNPATPFTLQVVGKTVNAPSGALSFRLAKPGRYPLVIKFTGSAQSLNHVFNYAGKTESLLLQRKAGGVWQLVAKSSSPVASLPVDDGKPDADFARRLAGVSDEDSATLSAAYDPTLGAQPQALDTNMRLNGVPIQTAMDSLNQSAAEPDGPSGVIKAAATDSAEGTSATFYDFKGERTDTVRIYIPSDAALATVPLAIEAVATNPDRPVVVAAANPLPQPVAPVVGAAPAVTSTAVADTVVAKDSAAFQNPFFKPEPAAPVVETPRGNDAVSINTQCTQLATDDEVQRLRKRMVNDGSDAGMLQLAGKAMRSKCFSVAQVQLLGVMFLNDEARFNFFEASKSRVYDSSNFVNLETQLIAPMWKQKLRSIAL